MSKKNADKTGKILKKHGKTSVTKDKKIGKYVYRKDETLYESAASAKMLKRFLPGTTAQRLIMN